MTLDATLFVKAFAALFAKAFAALFAIMNPFVALPMFLSLTSGFDAAEQRRTGLRTALYSAVLAVVLHFSAAIGLHLSQTLRTIMTRLMGMVLAAIAVEMLVAGLGTVCPGLV